jgi:hypothetical protein
MELHASILVLKSRPRLDARERLSFLQEIPRQQYQTTVGSTDLPFKEHWLLHKSPAMTVKKLGHFAHGVLSIYASYDSKNRQKLFPCTAASCGIWGFHSSSYVDLYLLVSLATCFKLVGFRPWRWKRHFPLKRSISKGVHGVIKEPGLRSRYRDWLRAGRPRGRSTSPGRVKYFLFFTPSRPVLGPTQPRIQCVPGVKRPGREADHSPPTSAEVKKMWIYTSTPPYAFMA